MNADHIGALVFFAAAIGLTVWGIHRRAQEHAFDKAVSDALGVAKPEPEPTELFVDDYPDEAWARLWAAIETTNTRDAETQAATLHHNEAADRIAGIIAANRARAELDDWLADVLDGRWEQGGAA